MNNVLLVGAGNIAKDYVRVLDALGVSFVVIGRSEQGCLEFKEKTGFTAIPGGIGGYPGSLAEFTSAILAVDASQLAPLACTLMEQGIRSLLVEKPGGLKKTDIDHIFETHQRTGAEVYIGYNRRFYTSVIRAKEMIEEDGGVRSVHFEFTEWPDTVRKSGLPQETLDSWFLCNSTHVVDLGFYFAGKPYEYQTYASGSASWTADHVLYAGAGITDRGVFFDYCANWQSPGRWGLEVMTDYRRFVLRPFEKLQIVNLNSVAIMEDISCEYRVDEIYKPGLYREVNAFLGNDAVGLLQMKTLAEQCTDFSFYSIIAGRDY